MTKAQPTPAATSSNPASQSTGKSTANANRAWQRMLSGRRLDLLDPSPVDIEIEDIAHGLARVARWNGQTTGDHALSVAQHVIIVEEICSDCNSDWPNKWRRAALLHDAAEYVVGDLISPFKNAIGLDYRELENRLLEAIHIRFSLPPKLPKSVLRAIKSADRISAYFEATVLAGFETKEADLFFGHPPQLSVGLQQKLDSLQPWPAREAQIRLLKRFESVNQDIN